MGLFDHFPYTNFHELNLDWILNALRELEHTIDQFVAINALKYADPIQWNIVSQYEKNTIVIDPLTGTAYISVQPVPAGVSITNTDYWTVVFDLGMFIVRAAQNFTGRWEQDTTLTATFPSNANDWIVWGDVLYKALVNITAGDQYVVDSNIKHITMEEIIGHLESLNTTDKSNLVAAINEVLQKLIDTVGDLNDLNTTDKSNLVAAVDELDAEIGDLNNLNTINDNDLVSAISEVNSKFVTPQMYGAKGDGVTDDTQAFIDAIAANSCIYIPPASYLITGTLSIPANTSLVGIKPISDTGDGARLICSGDFTVFEIYTNAVSIKDIIIEHDLSHTAPIVDFSDARYLTLENVILVHADGMCNCTAFKCDPNTWSGYIYFKHVYMSQYVHNLDIDITLGTFIDCLINSTSDVNMILKTGAYTFIGCDISRRVSDHPTAFTYDGTYGMRFSGCYFEAYDVPFYQTTNDVDIIINGNRLDIGRDSSNPTHAAYIFATPQNATGADMPRFLDGYHSGNNLIQNGSFLHDFLGWSGVSACTVVTSGLPKGFKAGFSLVRSGASGWVQPRKDLGFILKPGHYSLSFWAKFSIPAGTPGYFNIAISDSTGVGNRIFNLRATATNRFNDNTWHKFFIDIIINDSDTNNYRYLQFDTELSSCDIKITGLSLYKGINYIDDISGDSCSEEHVLTKELVLLGDNGSYYKITIDSNGDLQTTVV